MLREKVAPLRGPQQGIGAPGLALGLPGRCRARTFIVFSRLRMWCPPPSVQGRRMRREIVVFTFFLSFSWDPHLLIGIEPQETAQEMKEGMAALQARDFRTALEKFQRLEKLTPSNPQVLYFLCESYFGAGERERALAAASKLSREKQGEAALYG